MLNNEVIMVIFALILVMLCLYRVKFKKYHSDYISKSQTQSIKGLFAAIILLSHAKQYILPQLPFDNLVIQIINYIGQLMVAPFFFYSGYGILTAYRGKAGYSDTFCRKRILKTLVHFDIALLFFLPLPFITQTPLPWYDYVFCWIGWTSLGNTNWFVFVLLCLYVLTVIIFKVVNRWLGGEKIHIATVAISITSIVLWGFLDRFGKQAWWYNTLLCYPFGMWFAVYKDRFDKVIYAQLSRVTLSAFVLFTFICFYLMPGNIPYSICACFFCLLIVLLSTWVKIENSILLWLGRHSFSIYIIQRLPMELLKKANVTDNGLIYLLICIISTLVLAFLLQKLYEIIDATQKNIHSA